MEKAKKTVGKSPVNLAAALLPWLVLLLFAPMLSSCYNQSSATPDAWDLTKRQIDSISFSTTHHYSQNYNFVVKADSLCLVCQAPDELPFDSVTVYNGDYVVVADFMTMPGDTIDSVWVKIARDQITQGWIRERAMLPGVEPDNYISQFIDTFSDVHLLLFLALVVSVGAAYGLRSLFKRNAMIVHFHDIDSFYPTLLTLLVAGAQPVCPSATPRPVHIACLGHHHSVAGSRRGDSTAALVCRYAALPVRTGCGVRHRLRGFQHLDAVLRRLSALCRVCHIWHTPLLPQHPLPLHLRQLRCQDARQGRLSALRRIQRMMFLRAGSPNPYK